MNTSSRAYLIAALFVVCLCSVALFVPLSTDAPPAFAQAPTPTTEPPIAEPTLATSAAPLTKAADILRLVALTILGACLLWAILFFYTGWIQGKYFEFATRAVQRGVTVTPTIVGTEPFVGSPAEASEAFLRVEGPGSVVVGVQSDEYKAFRDNVTATPTASKWSAEPADAAAVNPATGSGVRVIATKRGVFTLTAEPLDGQSRPGSIRVAVIASQSAKIDLPTFGRGYGSIALAIVLLAIVLILGLTGVLPSAAIATLLGGLLGYIFQSRASSTTTQSSDGSQAPSEPD